MKLFDLGISSAKRPPFRPGEGPALQVFDGCEPIDPHAKVQKG